MYHLALSNTYLLYQTAVFKQQTALFCHFYFVNIQHQVHALAEPSVRLTEVNVVNSYSAVDIIGRSIRHLSVAIVNSTFVNCWSSGIIPNAVIRVWRASIIKRNDDILLMKTHVRLSNVSFVANIAEKSGILDLSNCNVFLHNW